MKVEVRTEQYEFSHGKLPRGIGNWAFSYSYCRDLDRPFFAPSSLSYGEAKKWAIKKAKKDRINVVYVCS